MIKHEGQEKNVGRRAPRAPFRCSDGLKAVRLFNAANVEVLTIPMLPVSNWKLDIGNSNNVNILRRPNG